MSDVIAIDLALIPSPEDCRMLGELNRHLRSASRHHFVFDLHHRPHLTLWQDYVDTQLMGTGHATIMAAIIGHDGEQWAASPDFNVTPAEGRYLVSAFNDSEGVSWNGLRFRTDYYITIKADARSIYGKKGVGGYCCVKTRQAILVSLYDETIQPGQCATVTEKLADYLIENGV